MEHPDILTVLYPMYIDEGKGDHDDRGTMFFIYSVADHRIVLGEFGHGEWSFESSVLTIKTRHLFFVSVIVLKSFSSD